MPVGGANVEEGFMEHLLQIVSQVEQRRFQRNEDARKVSCDVLDKLNHQIKTLSVGVDAILVYCNIALLNIFSLGPYRGGGRQSRFGERQDQGVWSLASW